MSKYAGRVITDLAPAGYSVYFDGTGDYLTVANNAAFGFGTGNFTVECWVYPSSFSANQTLVDARSSNSATPWLLGIGSTGLARTYDGSTARTGGQLTASAWNHVAWSRSGSTNNVYVNGVLGHTWSGNTDFDSSKGLTIGSGVGTTGELLTGYISNLRILKGTALYTAAFTPPTQLLNVTNTSLLTCNSPAIVDQSSNAFAITTNGNAAVSTFTPFAAYNPYNPALGASTPGVWTLDEAMQAAATRQWNMYDPSFQNTTLLLHGNGTNGAQNNTFLDSSSNNFTITRNGNTTQGSFSPFSQTGWSNFFNSVSDVLTTPSNAALSFGTGDFCIEAFCYQLTNTTSSGIFANGAASAGSIGFYTNSSGKIELAFYGGSNVNGVSTVSANVWNHIVATRSGTTVRVFLNGVLDGTGTISFNNTSSTGYVGAFWGGSSNCYISNLRVCKGAIPTTYQTSSITVGASIFTPPAAVISTTSQGASSVSLLACQSNRFVDNSSNGFSLTPSGSLSVQAFSPFYPTAAYTPATIGGGGYGGAGVGYLLAPASSNFQYPGDFSIETWVYVTTGDYGPIWGTAGGGGADQIYLAGSGSIFYGGAPSFPYFNSASSVVPYAWSHICITRQSGTLRIMINGILIGSRSLATTIGSATTGPGIFIRASLDDQISGPVYMADLRVCKGSVPTSYQTASTTAGTVIFTPPTQAITTTSQGATPANVSLLLNFTNAGIVDSTAKNVLETVGNAQISTAVSKFGGSSMYFDGSGDFLFSPATPTTLTGNTWTVECWYQPTSRASTYPTIVSVSDGNSNYANTIVLFDRHASASTKFSFAVASSGAITAGTTNVSNGTWYHLALVSNAGTVTLYVNGVSEATATVTAGSANKAIYVGANFDYASYSTYLNGYIDDLRITRGIARYTAAFTPQTSQWQDQ